MNLKGKINFIPQNINPDTLNNCAICGVEFEGKGYICPLCLAALAWDMEPEEVKLYENNNNRQPGNNGV